MYALTALMIGGAALGRAVDDPDLAARLLASCRQAAARLLEDPDAGPTSLRRV